MKGKAKYKCTTPQHGMVPEGETKDFDDIEAFDAGEYPYLKHFDPFGKAAKDSKRAVEHEKEKAVKENKDDDKDILS